METSFHLRFKSSMKINKNPSIFENLVPIEKTLKDSQIYKEFLVLRKEEKPTAKESVEVRKKNLPDLNFEYGHFLPPIIYPETTKAHLREYSIPNKKVLYNHPNKFKLFDPDRDFSPKQGLRFKFQGEVKHLIRSFDSKVTSASKKK